ncbi:MAG: hypothetical protein J6B74_00240 [Ruminococcus sp.]|nr:hypothetical protein [Ruminococcus sp.]
MALIIITVIYAFLPWQLKGLVTIINFFVPDSIPVIDELAMTIGFLYSVSKN